MARSPERCCSLAAALGAAGVARVEALMACLWVDGRWPILPTSASFFNHQILCGASYAVRGVPCARLCAERPASWRARYRTAARGAAVVATSRLTVAIATAESSLRL